MDPYRMCVLDMSGLNVIHHERILKRNAKKVCGTHGIGGLLLTGKILKTGVYENSLYDTDDDIFNYNYYMMDLDGDNHYSGGIFVEIPIDNVPKKFQGKVKLIMISYEDPDYMEDLFLFIKRDDVWVRYHIEEKPYIIDRDDWNPKARFENNYSVVVRAYQGNSDYSEGTQLGTLYAYNFNTNKEVNETYDYDGPFSVTDNRYVEYYNTDESADFVLDLKTMETKYAD